MHDNAIMHLLNVWNTHTSSILVKSDMLQKKNKVGEVWKYSAMESLIVEVLWCKEMHHAQTYHMRLSDQLSKVKKTKKQQK